MTGTAPHPWLSAYPDGVDWHAELTAKPLYQLFDKAAAQFPDRPYIDFQGKAYTYGEIAGLVDRAAAGFRKLGVRKGTKVGLYLPNCPFYLISFFGVLKAGGTIVNFSPLYSEPELEYQAQDSGVEMMVALSLKELYPRINAVLDNTHIHRLIVADLAEALPFFKKWAFRIFRRNRMAKVHWDQRHTAFADLIDNDGRIEPPDIDPEEDLAVLQYTGGTTGIPKGAMLTHANLSMNAEQACLALRDLRPGREVVHGVLPFFHIFALTAVALAPTMAGAKIVMHPRFHLKDALKDLEKKGVSILPGVPTMFIALNHALEEKKRDFPALKMCISGGAALPGEVRRKFESLTGAVMREGYGLTECSPVVCLTPPGGKTREDSIGLPVPGTVVTIVDPDDAARVLPLGETGELAVTGPQVMQGYWNNAEETAAVLQHGRLLTGDLGYIDEAGFTFIVDRKKETIKVSGYNVFPRTIEEALYKHPAVAEAAVIGIPDSYRGETPKAFVVLRKETGDVTAETLLAHLEERIGKHEMPESIEFRQKLPKTTVGKVDKKSLKSESHGGDNAGSQGDETKAPVAPS